MDENTRQAKRFQIGDLVLDSGKQEVSRDEHVIDLPGLSYQLIVVLAKAAPNVVSHDELVGQVWPGRVVSPETITQRIKLVRQAIGDDAQHPRYIGLVRGEGYRMLAEVEPLPPDPKKGYRIPAPVTELDDRQQALDKGRKAVWFYAIVPAVIFVAALATWSTLRDSAPGPGLDQEAVTSVAVLPFADLSPDQDQEYFAVGISEELLNELMKLEGLDVVSRTSSFRFKDSDEDLRAIGQQLGAANILEGSLRKDGDDLRVTAQLINASTGYHLWSNTYDRQIIDIFQIQEDIARSVAGALSITLDVDGREHLPGSGTSKIEAYNALLEGGAWHRIGRAAEAAAHYQRAIDLDPDYAQAWAALGAATGHMSWDQPTEQARASQERGRELVLRAIELDPNLAGAYADLAKFNWARGDWVGSVEARQAAAALLPGDMELRGGDASLLGRVGRVRAAIEAKELREKNPRIYYSAQIFAELYIQAGRYDDARAALEVSEALSPTTNPSIVLRRLFIAMSENEPADVRKYLEELADADPTVATIVSSVLAGFDSSPSVVLRALRRNYDEEQNMTGDGRVLTASLAAYHEDPEFALEVMTVELRGQVLRTRRLWYPFFSDMRKLPGFKTLADEVGFVAYWRRYIWADYCRPLSHDDFECF